MRTFVCKRLGVMLRLHRRADYLPTIFRQIRSLGRGREVVLVCCYDRASQEVIRTVDRLAAKMPPRCKLVHTEAPTPVVSSAGERWVESIAHCHAHIVAEGCDVGMLWDDDLLYSAEALRELRAHLQFFEHDRLDALWLHMWDEPDTHNAAFPPHWAAAAFRVYPGDGYTDPTCLNHAPQACAWSDSVGVIQGPAYHYGYYTEDARRTSWASLKRAGKVDSHTLCLTQPPKKEKVSGTLPRQPHLC